MHFVRSSDGLTGRNLTKNDLSYLWCGVKANYGVKSGKACYECKVRLSLTLIVTANFLTVQDIWNINS